MKFTRGILALSLSFVLSNVLLPATFIHNVAAQTTGSNVALQRGYRTGYSDGYMAGYRDTIDSLAKNYGRHDEYARANRAFNKDYGLLDDYKDGYQQGFESGYNTGFDKRSFESSLPTDLKKRGVVTTGTQGSAPLLENNVGDNRAVITESNDNQAAATVEPSYNQSGNGPIIVIPRDTELMLELQDDLSTERSRAGDKFSAKIVSPSEIAGATIEGRIAKITQPGRLKRRSELSLSFDRIILSDNRWSNMSATLVEVMPVKGDNVKLVDTEGTAVGQSSLKSDATKVGGATGAGLVVGAVVGGPVGAAVGAGMGAAFGVGAVVIERGKHIRLNRNQQITVKTAYETRIR